ncbi:MAG: helix-turn-helix transcriptional regulator [Ruminococcaceae bacterium]|nr:helix-turn-helix transcriptional regulator [Oscillospiraceae bacterium]
MKNKIKECREKKGIRQTEFANRLGVSQSAVAMWETGHNLPRAELLPKMAEVLHCTVDELLGRENGKQPQKG